MELKFERTACRCMRSLAREVQNVEQTQELRLPEGMPDIGRVIGAWGQVMLRSKEWRGDGMSAAGGVTVWVLYAPDDGSEAQCVDVWLPFQGKWSFPETDREGVIRLIPLLRSVDARTVSARKLMIRAGIGLLAEALVPFEAEVYTPGDMPAEVELLRHTYPVKLTREAREKTFLLDEELSMPGSCPAIQKLMRYEMLPQLVDQRVMVGKVVFRGNGLLHILYRGEDGGLYTWDFEIPFSQFTELEEDFGQEAEPRIALALTSLELDKMEDGSLRLKCGLVAQCAVTDQVLLEIGEDAYSPVRDVKPNYYDAVIPAVLDDRTEQQTWEVPLDLECAKVVDLSFLPDHPAVSRMGDQVKAYQTGTFQLLYEDPAGSLQSALRRWEQDSAMNAADDSTVAVELMPCAFPAAQLTGGSVVIKGNICVNSRTETARGQKMMAGMELGEAKKPDRNRPSVILRRAEGERLWDLAKGCGTTVQAICQANGLTDEPDSGRMLLIPVM